MTTTQRVRNILAAVPASRNSDTELLIIYLQKMGMNLTDHQIQLLKDAPSTETIRRIRQKIQAAGDYKADPEVQKERKHKAMVMQQTSPKFSPEQIEKTLGIKVMPWGTGV